MMRLLVVWSVRILVGRAGITNTGVLLLIFGGMFLSACATMSVAERARLTEIAGTSIYCQGKDDCEVKWGRAILWVSNNSHWKIRNQTDSLITTEGPFDSLYAAYSVNKVPLGNAKYQIIMKLGCGNMFGCVPKVLVLKADFVKSVLGNTGDQ